jgi:ribosomal protein S18 acetylase RimI-like enzyme
MFRRFDPARLPELMTWFPDPLSVRTWGGDDRLAAFGQCYLRIERCHFGRLAVSPTSRGQGLGSRLISELAGWGLGEFGARELSLFVSKHNEPAHRLYRRLGFIEATYPDPTPHTANTIYMIAERLHHPPDAHRR